MVMFCCFMNIWNWNLNMDMDIWHLDIDIWHFYLNSLKRSVAYFAVQQLL